MKPRRERFGIAHVGVVSLIALLGHAGLGYAQLATFAAVETSTPIWASTSIQTSTPIQPTTPAPTLMRSTSATATAQLQTDVWFQTALRDHYIVALAIDPSSSTTLYAGTGDGSGLFKSTDAGMSWMAMNMGLPTTPPMDVPTGINVVALAIDRTNSTTLYAGASFLPTQLFPLGGGGLYKSVDGAMNWEPMNTGLPEIFPEVATPVTLAEIDPTSASTIYSGSFLGVFKSTDGALSWSPSHADLPNFSVDALVVDPTTPDTVYVAIGGGPNGGVFKSTNGGVTWIPMNMGLPRSPDIRALAIDRANPMTLYAGSFGGGVFRSVDGGMSWNPMNMGLTAPFVTMLSTDPITSTTLYAVVDDGAKVFKSTDRALSWTPLSTGLPVGDVVYAFAVDPITPTRLYSGTYYGGVFRIDQQATIATPTGTPSAVATPSIGTVTSPTQTITQERTTTGTPDITATRTVPPPQTATRTWSATPSSTRTSTATVTSTRTGTDSPTATPTRCVGDCDQNGNVTVNELVAGVNIALGSADVAVCASFDSNGDGSVTVSELVAAVSNALNGCGYTPPTPLSTHTPTRTFTPSSTVASTPSGTPTETATRTNTATSTSTSTSTPTPRVVQINVGSGRGLPGGSVVLTVALVTSGAGVAATANDVSFEADLLDLNPGDCAVNLGIKKTLLASIVGQDSFYKTLRFFIQSDQNRNLIPDGPLYTCRFHIAPSDLPGDISLTNDNMLAFGPDGSAVENVIGTNGSVTVSLVP